MCTDCIELFADSFQGLNGLHRHSLQAVKDDTD